MLCTGLIKEILIETHCRGNGGGNGGNMNAEMLYADRRRFANCCMTCFLRAKLGALCKL